MIALVTRLTEETNRYYDQESDKYAQSWDDEAEEHTAPRSKKPTISNASGRRERWTTTRARWAAV